MPAARSNRLLPVIGFVVFFMLVFVLLRSCGGNSGDNVTLQAIPESPAPDADSPAETIRTLVAEVSEISSSSKEILENNESLSRELKRREQSLDREVKARVDAVLEEHKSTNVQRSLKEALKKIDSLSGRVEELNEREESRATPDWDIPVGLGLEGDNPGLASPNDRPAPGKKVAPPRLQWVNPLGWEEEGEGADARNTVLKNSPMNLVSRTKAGSPSSSKNAGNTPSANSTDPERKESVRRPVYTVPRNATMMNSVAMTALIGRVPKGGKLEDPMPFKIIQGEDNLAANGHFIPGVAGMVWSGTASGDWNLSCVRGQLDSVTFIFDDGTVRTLPDHNPAVGPGEPKDATGDTEPLGWISDVHGVPCIDGRKVTDAPQFLAQRAGLAGLEAAAEAFAAGEVTTSISAEGTRIGTITGMQGRYIGGQMVSGGAKEAVRWLIERQEQSFDAVVTESGIPVHLHIERELRIDHVSEPTGRKLSYEENRNARAVRLD